VSYGPVCISGVPHRGCQTVTDGYLSKSGADVTWGSVVPLGQPFSVRDPLWAWGSGRNLTVPAGADPGGVRQTHPPDRSHHGSGARCGARRG
jgi:hypothetical protein